MSLPAGTKLGPYEIIAAIGAGGMGEVYRARDSRLNRMVAVKVLPASFSTDPERLRRFEQEAMSAAALNDPGIVAVYDVGTQDGFPYVVSELLEGETLRDRLRSGPLSSRRSVELGIQTARALAAAHDKGIIHRDLKPENIFVTRQGRIKILDFGLAKLLRREEAAAVPGQTVMPTVAADTTPGMVLGTVGYMAPEQVRGLPADARSDIFALGTILYEILSGQRAFKGATAADTMIAIVKEEPPEITEAGRDIPPAVERIVRHCLEKGPEERFRSAHDVAFALENVSHTSQSGVAIKAVPESTSAHLKLVLWVLAVAVVAAGGFLAWSRTRQASFPTFRRLTFERGMITSARFSADAHSVVYAASWQNKPLRLFSSPLELPQPQPLEYESASLLGMAGPAEMALAIGGTVTHHGVIRDATLATAPMAGGAPREILEQVRAADWGPDGKPAVVHFVNGRSRIEYPIGQVLYETGNWISHLRVSPKGDRIAFLLHGAWTDDRGVVAMVDLAGNLKKLTQEWEAEEGLAWSPRDDEVWFSATPEGTYWALYAVTTAGKLRTVLRVPGMLKLHDIAPDGRVLFNFEDERVGMKGGHEGSPERDLSWFSWTIAESISPDGKWVVFSEQGGPAGDAILGMRGLDGSAPRRLGVGNAFGFSHDGKWVIRVPGDYSPHITLLPTGPGQPKPVEISDLESVGEATFFPDGKRLLLIGGEHGHAYRTYVVDVAGGKPTPITPEGITPSIVLSPDGNELAARDFSGTITIFSLQGEQVRTVPNTQGMLPLTWSSDGRYLFTTVPDQLPARILQVEITSGKQQLLRQFAPSDSGIYLFWNARITPDGKTYAYSYRQTLSTLFVAEGLH